MKASKLISTTLIAVGSVVAVQSPVQGALTYVDAVAKSSASSPDDPDAGSPNTFLASDGSSALLGSGNDTDWEYRDSGPGKVSQDDDVYQIYDSDDDPAGVTKLSGLSANTDYNLRLYYVGKDTWSIDVSVGDQNNYVEYTDENGTQTMSSGSGDTGYYADLPVGSTDGSGELEVYMRPTEGSSRSYYDGLAYEAVPEPASLALLGFGGLVMLGRCRRKT